MVRYEWKKVFGRTSGKVALLFLLLLTVLNCWFALDITYVNEEGKSIEGLFAIAPLREAQQEWAGELTEARLAEVIQRLNEIDAMPEGQSDSLRDEQITYHRKQGLDGIRDLLNQSFAPGFQEYDYYAADRLSPEQAGDFYANRTGLLKAWLQTEVGDTFNKREKAFLVEHYEGLNIPLYYEYNLGWSQLLDIISGLIMPGALIICFLVAGIFSNEFTWKSDGVFSPLLLAAGRLSPQKSRPVLG